MEARVRNVFWLRFMTALNEPFISFFGIMITTKGFIYLTLAFAILFLALISPGTEKNLIIRLLVSGTVAGLFGIFAVSSESPTPFDLYLILAIRYLFKPKGARAHEKKEKRKKANKTTKD